MLNEDLRIGMTLQGHGWKDWSGRRSGNAILIRLCDGVQYWNVNEGWESGNRDWNCRIGLDVR